VSSEWSVVSNESKNLCNSALTTHHSPCGSQWLKMHGETNLSLLIKTMTPELNEGEYVFCTVSDSVLVNAKDIICSFKEKEGRSIIITKQIADSLHLSYSFICSWITLTVHSSLEAVGLTAAFAKALSEAGISCNVVAAFYHDHIFVAKEDGEKAMEILRKLSVSF
jgi:hypothetical protein